MNGASTVLSGVFASRYEIERELGRGGTAVVYLARDKQRGHNVAIKVLRPEFAQSVGADRFLKEIRLTEKLHHPHIVPVLDSGDHAGRLYFVLPYMEGGTLRQRLERDKQLTVDDVVAITRSVGAALQHAHGQGLIHRDVKPENILFTSGQACLADFGIARALETAADASITSTSIVRGTPAYMSPEQASGERELDARTDVYSLACVVYEMLAGIQPFVGPTPESVIAQRLLHPPRPLKVFRRSLPEAIQATLERGLAVARADRYQSAIEFAEALEVAARTPDDVAGRARRRLRTTYWALATLGVAAAIVGAATLMTPEPAPARDTIPDGDPRRVAVLYLDDLTPETVPAHVADGLTEDLIDRLGSVRPLHVTSAYGVRPYRGSTLPIDSIGRALKVGTIVAGSVARSGSTTRVQVRLVDAATGRQINSHTIEHPWTEWFALQDTVVNRIAFVLRERLGAEIALRRHRSATRSYEAWETVQRASAETQRALAASRRSDPQGPFLYLSADSLYARAAQLDPSWSLPNVRRARLAIALGSQTSLSPSVSDSLAYRALSRDDQRLTWYRRALALADAELKRSRDSDEALTVRADANYNIWTTIAQEDDSLVARIERDLRDAIAIRPETPAAWSILAQLLYVQGRFVEAARAAQRAYEADAFFEVRRTLFTAFNASLYAERFDDARRWCRLSLERYADDQRFTDCEVTIIGWTGRSRSDVADAWRIVSQRERSEAAGEAWAPTYRRLMIAAVLARAGLEDSARSLLAHIQEQQRRDPNRQISGPLGEAYVYLLLNERDSAITQIAAYLSNATAARKQIAQHPWFRALHGDQRFEALVRPSP